MRELKAPPEIAKLSWTELQSMCWELRGVRVSPSATRRQMIDLLCYKEVDSDIAGGPINKFRNTLMSFIRQYEDRLSLRCDGNCMNHADGVVVACYIEFLRDMPDVEVEEDKDKQ